MSINIPKNQKELVESSKTDFQRETGNSNPFTKNSYVGALITAPALRTWDAYQSIKILEKEIFPQTASVLLPMFGEWYNVPQNQATKATGNIVATGTATTNIPISTQVQSTTGAKYLTTAAKVITANSRSVTSMVRSGSTVTVTTSVAHEYASQTDVVIAGAVETDYNGTHSINVVDATTFTFTISTTPSSPATGTITAAQDSILVPIESVDFGSAVNLSPGDSVTLSSPIAGVDSTMRVDYAGVSGGADAESNVDWQARILERIRNPVANFNANAIIQKAKEVSGVTRVWVKEVTPSAGSVTIYFVRDNDASIIPSAGDITTTKNKILEIKPADLPSANVIVSAPTAVLSNFTFTSITPDTTEMRSAITASINSNAKLQNEGEDWREDDYRAAINGTVDRATNAKLENFTLSLTGDVTIAAGEIATVGMISF